MKKPIQQPVSSATAPAPIQQPVSSATAPAPIQQPVDSIGQAPSLQDSTGQSSDEPRGIQSLQQKNREETPKEGENEESFVQRVMDTYGIVKSELPKLLGREIKLCKLSDKGKECVKKYIARKLKTLEPKTRFEFNKMDGALVAFISRYGLTPYDFTVEGADRMERKLLNASLEEKALVELIKQYLRGF